MKPTPEGIFVFIILALLITAVAFLIYHGEVEAFQNGRPCLADNDCMEFCMNYCKTHSLLGGLLREFKPQCHDGIFGKVCGLCGCRYYDTDWRPYVEGLKP